MTRSTSVIPCKLSQIWDATPAPGNEEGWYTVEEIAHRQGRGVTWARQLVREAVQSGAWKRGTRIIVSPLDGKRYPVPVYRPVE
jgi:hypothetical protein